MANFTFFDFQELTNNEKDLSKILHNEDSEKPEIMPSKSSINNILNFSKALSVRKSETLGYIENNLN